MTGPPNKIVQNLATFLCSDTEFVPVFESNRTVLDAVLSFKTTATPAKPNDVPDTSSKPSKLGVARRGAQGAFIGLSQRFSERLFESTPKLWELISKNLLETYSNDGELTVFGMSISRSYLADDADEILGQPKSSRGQDILDSLTLLNTILPTLHESLYSRVAELFPLVAKALRSRFALVRQVAAECFSQACSVMTVDAMRFLIVTIMPFLGDPKVVAHRQGTIELIYREFRPRQ